MTSDNIEPYIYGKSIHLFSLSFFRGGERERESRGTQFLKS